MKRREFLQKTTLFGLSFASFHNLHGAVREETHTQSDDLKTLINSAEMGDFIFKAPALAENGAAVPLTVDARNLANVERIDIILLNANTPLSGSYRFFDGAKAYVKTRIKMTQGDDVAVLVKANGKYYKQQKNIQLTTGWRLRQLIGETL